MCFLTGLFGDTCQQLEDFASNARAVGGRAVCQPWWHPAAVAEDSVPRNIAERAHAFGVKESDMQNYSALPAYIFLIGPFQDLNLQNFEDAPRWRDWSGCRFEDQLLPLQRVPVWKYGAPIDVSLGSVKQKKADFNRWYAGIDQLLLWVGSSKQGAKAREKWLSHHRAR